MNKNTAVFKYLKVAPYIADLDSNVWSDGGQASITDLWSGERASDGRQATARLLWSDSAMYIRFEATVAEPLVVSESPDISQKTIGLWERDVCEIFVAPDRTQPNKYFEFEVAPTGEWLDVGIEVTPTARLSDWKYSSGMKCSARIDESRVLSAIEIPWSAFGRTPTEGDVWLGNLFRCVGAGPERGYLAWRPTCTEVANFHVPAAFGQFIFVR